MSSTRMLPISNPAHHLLSLCQSKVYYFLVRKKPFTEWKQGHTPVYGFETPAFGGGFFLDFRTSIQFGLRVLNADRASLRRRCGLRILKTT